MEFKKAVKTKQKLRLAIDGISGSGKTYTALAIVSGMGGNVALIDSEHGSASLYADRFSFDTLELTEFQIENYVNALDAAQQAGYPIVIIDSTSHAWDALLERVDRIAANRYKSNSFRAWGEGTPLQKKLVEAMLNYPGHVIVTCRLKTEYSVDKDEKGKTEIKKIGTQAIQRQGFEYEFTMTMRMDINHVGLVTKDRTGKFQDSFIEKPGKELGKELISWLNEGAAPPPMTTPPTQDVANQCKNIMLEIGNILDNEISGVRLFSLEEKDKVKETIKTDLSKYSAEQTGAKLEYLNTLLETVKTEMRMRIEAENKKEAATAAVTF